jgi:DNA-binding transcriptional MocR family regulator
MGSLVALLVKVSPQAGKLRPHTSALARFIEDGGFARHIRKMGGVYRTRHDILTNALTRELADHLELIPSAAGLHIAAVEGLHRLRACFER